MCGQVAAVSSLSGIYRCGRLGRAVCHVAHPLIERTSFLAIVRAGGFTHEVGGPAARAAVGDVDLQISQTHCPS